MDALKRIEKIRQENAFELKKEKPGLKLSNPGLAKIGLQTTEPRGKKKRSSTRGGGWGGGQILNAIAHFARGGVKFEFIIK